MDAENRAALLQSIDRFSTAIQEKTDQLESGIATQELNATQLLELREVDGIPYNIGTVRKAIFQGFVGNIAGGGEEIWSQGDFGTVPNLGTNANVYLHLKVPVNINVNSEMLWFHLTGYAFGSAKMIDETIVGYSYAVSKALLNNNATGNFSPTLYTDVSGNVVIRLLFPSIYYTTLKIDTMRVGNGRLFNKGDLVARLSLSANVNF
jgi:hypothetical protein